jgi:hypothetical protein
MLSPGDGLGQELFMSELQHPVLHADGLGDPWVSLQGHPSSSLNHTPLSSPLSFHSCLLGSALS